MYSRSQTCLFSIFAVCSSLAACSGSPSGLSNAPDAGSTGGAGSGLVPGTGPVALDDFPHEMAVALCNLLARCNPNSIVSTPEYTQQCVNQAEKAFADQSIPALQTAIAAGKVAYDGSKLRSCLDVYPQLACDYSNVSVLEAACGSVWGGAVASGGICNSSFECASTGVTNNCKSSTSTCPGVCSPRSGVGEACPSTDDCLENLACDATDHLCKVPLKSGDACGSSNPNGGVCGGVTRCVQSPSGQSQCGSLLGTLGHEGDICSGSLGCLVGLACTRTSELADGGTSPIFRCEKPATATEFCQYTLSNTCPDGQFCPYALTNGTSSSHCTAQIEPGQACTGNYLYECKGDARCANGTCLARQRVGGTCVSDVDCYTNKCANSVCVAYGLCGP